MEMDITYWVLSAAVHAQSNIQDEFTVYYNAPLCSLVVLLLPACAHQLSLLQRGTIGFRNGEKVFWGKAGWKVADEELTSLTVTPKQIFQAGT